jgi:hypothetical protein
LSGIDNGGLDGSSAANKGTVEGGRPVQISSLPFDFQRISLALPKLRRHICVLDSGKGLNILKKISHRPTITSPQMNYDRLVTFIAGRSCHLDQRPVTVQVFDHQQHFCHPSATRHIACIPILFHIVFFLFDEVKDNERCASQDGIERQRKDPLHVHVQGIMLHVLPKDNG